MPGRDCYYRDSRLFQLFVHARQDMLRIEFDHPPLIGLARMDVYDGHTGAK